MMDRLGWRMGLLGLAAALLAATGCIRRTLTINTAPQGARVLLNDQEIGTSPVSTDFTWYGDYNVTLQKPGYQTLNTNQVVQTPWYQLPGVDFFTEILWPFTVHDQREYTFELHPTTQPISRQELLENARQLQERAIFGED